MVEPRRLSALAADARSFLRSRPGDLVVALSGGADSAAAAWLAVDSGNEVRAVHVHHGADASDRLEEAARAIAGGLGIPLAVECVQVVDGSSYESQARSVRHRALRGALRDGERLVVGHTRDDQVETVLMRLVRGSGLDGMAGMAADDPPYLRPLLDTTRSAARELATLVGLPWIDDPANLDRRHLRNRVRNDLIPVIEATFGPGLATTLHRSAAVIRQDVALLDELATAIEHESEPGIVRMSIEGLSAARPAIAARAVRSAIRGLQPPYPPPLRVVESALEVARGEAGRADIGDLAVTATREWLVLSIAPPSR